MLTCPYCRSPNPDHHNFCQGCGRSLKHYICPTCNSNVEVDAQSCPQCQTISGTYWQAIIEPTVTEPTTAVAISDPDPLAAIQAQARLSPPPLPTDIAPSTSDLQSEFELSPWDLPSPVQEASPVEIAPANLAAGTIVDDLETSPWDWVSPPTPSRADSLPQPAGQEAISTDPSMTDSQPLVATTYLDPRCQYRLLDPVVIQLLAPTDSSQVLVIDRQPFCNSPLEILMEQQPVTLNTPVDDIVPRHPGAAPAPTHRQWAFWNDRGIPKVAQAYIALQVSLPGTIPAIRDSWENDGKTVTIVEDRSKWTQLSSGWNDPSIPTSQTIYWLDQTLKLWVTLEPWQMRQSLLEIGNLLLDEDARICFQRLYPETDRHLKLADLAQMWQKLCDRAYRFDTDAASAQKSPTVAIANLIESIQSGELERVEEVRSRLQQIAYELEPKQLSAPLQSTASGDLSIPHDAPTIGIAKKLIGLEDAAATHTGKKRDHNEDCFGVVSRIERQDSPKGKTIAAQGLYILCDGMGGHAGGEIASSMTVDILRDYFATRWGDTLPDEQTIREGIVAANEAVHEINQQNAAHGSGRMGTTLVLVLVQDQNIAVAHVGDSRCYGITPTQGLIQLTLDHEVGQQQILRGVDPEIAYGRPDSYQLTQAIGPRDRNYIAPDIRFFELQEDTLILLASDGLTDNQLLENYWLTNVAPLLSPNANLQDGVDRLIDFANEYNGHDNITALVVRAKLG
ncbi:serine/threonine phosphatase [Chamaesiphon sp.]|uniref:serine/threonine phosphatase n=1 Tax=Chamaesiphon sp. TaxID=2814140 RepID=UPI0035946A9A